VFGWVVAFAKASVSCDFEKSSCEKHAMGKAEDRLVQQLWLLKHMLNSPHIFYQRETPERFVCEFVQQGTMRKAMNITLRKRTR
jgi:hypothetical protein